LRPAEELPVSWQKWLRNGGIDWKRTLRGQAGSLSHEDRLEAYSTHGAKGKMLERIDHVNIVVGNMQTMIGFYRDLLGMRLTKQAVISGRWIEAATGLSSVEAEVAFLQAPTGPGIELIHYRTSEGPSPEGLGRPNTKGFRHIAFRVRDIEGLVATLKAAGVALLSEVQQVPATQVDYADQRKRLVYFHDPEGNLLELCAFDS
jgi:glyoxylase I family protein